MKRMFLAGGLLAALVLAACGGSPTDTGDAGGGPAGGACLEGTPDCDDTGILDGDEPTTEPSAGMCAPEMPDCDDTAIGDDTSDGAEPIGDAFDSQAALVRAETLLGLVESELGMGDRDDVRIGRRGEEHLMLTEDYRVGRMTLELDINDMDEWIVTGVTVELPDGPQTVTRHLT